MANQVVRIGMVSDESILRFFDGLVRAFPPSSMEVHVGSSHLGSFTNIDGLLQAFPERNWDDSRVITRVTANLRNGAVHINFSRLLNPPSRWETELSVNQPGNPVLLPKDALQVWTLISDFRSKTTSGFDGNGISPDLQNIFAQQFTQMSELHARIVHDAEAARIEFEKWQNRRREDLDKEYAARSEQLELSAKDREASFVEEKAALADRVKKLDDREHMHVRRELRSQITEDLKARLQSPGVSSQSLALRFVIAGLSIASIVAFVVYAGIAAMDLHVMIQEATKYHSPNDLPPLIQITAPVLTIAGIKLLLPVAAATGLFVYLLSWLRRLHYEDVRAERELERYRYDIDRASWVVETLLEARNGNSNVPPEWIDGVTRNLFSRSENHDVEHNALEAVAALLGVSAEADLGPGGLNLKLRRDGLRKLGKGAEAK